MTLTAGKTETEWKSLSPDEKMNRRFEAWLAAPGIEFVSPQAEKDYKTRVRRFTDAMRLKKTPDRVPVSPNLANFAPAYCGYTDLDLMTDPNKAVEVAMRCTVDFQLDAVLAVGGYPARSLEILDWKLFNWPGHGVSENAGYQFLEGEYMTADEYDAFIDDPSDFWWRTYLPRITGALEPLKMLSPSTYYNGATAIPANLSRYALPEIQSALAKLGEAGKLVLDWQQKTMPVSRKLNEMGFPSYYGSSAEAPFDIMGDALRGTRGIVMDMYRHPDKLLEAMGKVTKMMIKMGVSAARLGNSPVCMMPLHKGADGFMSDGQFRKFYWPSLKDVCLGLIEEGIVPLLFAEGGYNTRLEVIRDLPRGKTIWYFDYTDMSRAKETLGNTACIQGNVPLSLLEVGTPEDVETYCRKLIDTAGKDGGFILSPGGVMGRSSKTENVRTMLKCAREYGVYR